MTPEAFLAAVRRHAVHDRCVVTDERVGGRPALAVVNDGSSALDSVTPLLMIVVHLPGDDLESGALDEFAGAARDLARARRGRWGTPGLSLPAGPVGYMPVAVTSGAGDQARAWASKKRGLCFPALVDLGDRSVTRWRHAIIGAANAVHFAHMAERILEPALEG